MGEEVADRREERVRIHHLNRIDAAGVAIDQVGAGKGQLPVDRLPGRRAVGRGQDAAVGEKIVLVRAIEAAHAAHAVGHVGRKRVRRGNARVGRGPDEIRVLHQHARRVNVAAVVPDVGDDHAAIRAGKVDGHAARRVVGGVQAGVDRHVGQLARRGIGALARGHGQNLLAHDHEAVVEDAHHHDQKDGQDEGELDEGLALASASRGAQANEERGGLHGSSGYMLV
jgi:hypothetical protein